ncbi:MAG: ParA family protein [Syntrophothermus sp.]|uniref:ParA family protein n=1 Tax=Syntrophothermus sp. TaxID=2736299 RepID=UPI00258053E0|nr:ParA family protein [Syntrophothermus sp.]NSW83149.1 ParA family protein [Syntrophothermus sp.]
MPAKIISIINIKGGVGKSTIAMNLAHAIRRMDRNVLLIDVDMQSNLTDMAIKDVEKITATVYDVIMDEERTISQTIYESVIPGVDIVPSDLRLIAVQREIDPIRNPDSLVILRNKIDQEARQKYDYIIIDCRPDVDLLTVNALMASHYYMIPVFPDRHSVKGIKLTDTYLRNILKSNRDLKELGIVINNFDTRTTLSKLMYSKLSELFGQRLMKTVIKVNQGIATAAARRQSVFQFDLRQSGCHSFRKLASEVLERVGDIVISEADVNEDEEVETAVS